MVDVLQAHLVRARASGGVFARSVAQPPWGLRLPGTIPLTVHAVIQGRMWLWLDDRRSPLELAPGDVALVRGGPDHFIGHKPNAACLPPEQFQARHADDGRASTHGANVFLCGAYVLSGDVGRGLLEALPPILTLSAAADDPLHDVIGLLSSQLATSAPGQQTLLDRLLDVLLVVAMRACFQRSEHAPRWYQALADPRLGPALVCNARRRLPPVDCAGAGSNQEAVTCGVRPDLSPGARSGAHAVPNRMAHDSGTRSPACREKQVVRAALVFRRQFRPPVHEFSYISN